MKLIAGALLLSAMPMLAGCFGKTEPVLQVRPAEPEPQAKLTLPRAMTDPVPLPSFGLPAKTSTP